MYLCKVRRYALMRAPIYKNMTINEIQDEIIEEFEGLTDWMDRYAYIIELGGQLQPMEERYKTPANLIEGCQSRVWLEARLDDEGRMQMEADSDAMIVKGIVSLLMRVLNSRHPREVLDADLYFIDRIGLRDHLSPTRSNGLVAMVKQIKLYAAAWEIKSRK